MFQDERSEKHRVLPGGALRLMLPAGHEIHCLHGRATITVAPAMLGDNLFVPVRTLHPGQAWRSDEAQWVTVGSGDAQTACVVASVQPQACYSASPKANSPAAWATGLLAELALWIRRVLNAASTKSP